LWNPLDDSAAAIEDWNGAVGLLGFWWFGGERRDWEAMTLRVER
jgi:hypothetical protein